MHPLRLGQPHSMNRGMAIYGHGIHQWLQWLKLAYDSDDPDLQG